MDRMSGLSDELLIKILMLLPTKEAVSTSILSKRWEFLWMWLPRLEFYSRCNSSKSECNKLQYFLDRNLPLYRAPILESLRLELCNSHFSSEICHSHFKPESISMWVVIAVSCCVRELEISCCSYPDKPDVFPTNLYICKSLVILKLSGKLLLDVPRMVSLPSLKTLQLKNVRYFSDETLQRLLSKCPVLEDLSVELHEDDIMGRFTIIVPSLKRLSIYIPYLYDIDGYEIDTPSLEYFKLKDHNNESHYCVVDDMPNLIEAYVDVEFPNIENLIGSITSVKHLTICSEVVYEEDFVFYQLEHLRLCRCKEKSSSLLVRLLNDSPNLQELDLFEMHDHYHNGTVSWTQPSTVPKCVSLSLHTFRCSIYTGVPDEKDLAVYILNNAGQLKTTTISSEEIDVPRFEMIKELAMSSRASATCQLIFD